MNINEFGIAMEDSSKIITNNEMKSYEDFIASVAKDVVFSNKSQKFINKVIHQSAQDVFGGHIYRNEHYIMVFECDQDENVAISKILDDIIIEAKKRKPEMLERIDIGTGDGDEGCLYLKPKKKIKMERKKEKFSKKEVGNAVLTVGLGVLDCGIMAVGIPLAIITGVVTAPIDMMIDSIKNVKSDREAKKNGVLLLSKLESHRVKNITPEMKNSSLSYFKNINPKHDQKIVMWTYKNTWTNENDIVALAAVRYDIDKYKWITAMQINNKYKGRGLDDQIIDYCIDTMDASAIALSPKNKDLIELYKKHGFKINKAWSNSKYNNGKKIIMTTY